MNERIGNGVVGEDRPEDPDKRNDYGCGIEMMRSVPGGALELPERDL